MTPRRAAVAVASAVIAASGCSAFKLDNVPPEVMQAFERDGDPMCTPDARRAQRVASGEDVDGTKVELWLAPGDGGGDVLAVMVQEPGAERMGSGGWCNVDAAPDIVNTFGGMGMTSADGREREIVLGWAPEQADAVRADFGDREVVVEVGASGYFIVVHSEPGGDDMIGGASPRLTALDGDGNPL